MPGKLFIPDLTTNQMAFPDTAPRKGDSDNNLLFKIAQELSEQNGGAFAPMLGDSDNNLLRKILQLLILGGGGGDCGTCPADLVTCNSALAACEAALIACEAESAETQQNRVFAETNPATYNIAAAFGYTTSNTNFPGLLGLTFIPSSTIAGYAIRNQTSLLTLAFPNLTSVPASGVFEVVSNSVLTSLSAPLLVTNLSAFSPLIQTNVSLTSVSMPVLTTSRGWTFTGNSAIVSLSLPALTTISALSHNLSSNVNLQTISMPNLVSTPSSLNFGSNPALNSLVLTSLTTSTGTITLTNDVSLVTLTLPALVTSGSFTASGCTTLANISFPNYLPTNATNINFGAAALTQASVDHVLARAVANAAYISGTITLNGGTSSTPSAAGLVNKATLQARGCVVNTN